MRILITGATGLVGSEIIALCKTQGVEVHYLTTNRSKIKETESVKGFYWNPKSGEIDRECFEGVEAIVNLAGEPIAQRWTSTAKKEIVDSRVKALQLLHRALAYEEKHKVRILLTASAIGVYPDSLGHYYEETEKNTDPSLPGRVVQQWEAAADSIERLGIKVAKIRIGLVLSSRGGALPRMSRPIKYWLGAPLGRGTQWQSWIHISDLAQLFLFVVNRNLPGVFNGVAPEPVTNTVLTKKIAAKLKKPLLMPKLPSFLLYWSLGKMAYLLLSSQRVSSRKVTDMGFSFQYTTLDQALDALCDEEK
ncbi:TIGR01777 family oxidoreductase [Sinomicrobium sp.]